jgi:hypothetical protein
MYFYREKSKQDEIDGAENPAAVTEESGMGENYIIWQKILCNFASVSATKGIGSYCLSYQTF